MDQERLSLTEYFDSALSEVYSLEEMLVSFGQNQMADVLRSCVEMAYGKLREAERVISRDIGQVYFQVGEYNEPQSAVLAAKPSSESLQ